MWCQWTNGKKAWMIDGRFENCLAWIDVENIKFSNKKKEKMEKIGFRFQLFSENHTFILKYKFTSSFHNVSEFTHVGGFWLDEN